MKARITVQRTPARGSGKVARRRVFQVGGIKELTLTGNFVHIKTADRSYQFFARSSSKSYVHMSVEPG